MLLPSLGIIESYGGRTSEYYNAFGLYLTGMGILKFVSRNVKDDSFALVWSCLNFIFFLASLSTYVTVLPIHPSLYCSRAGRLSKALRYRNVANIIVYGALELLYILNSAAKFAMADGDFPTGRILTRTAGAFGAISAFSGFYLLYQGLCEQVSPVPVPLGELHCFEPRINFKKHTRGQAQ